MKETLMGPVQLIELCLMAKLIKYKELGPKRIQES